MLKSHPLVTIGMTCFNAEKTIEVAIKSALSQDYPNFEIVLVDDCSDDSSREILQKMVLSKDNIRVINHEQNLGFASALNTIISNASGEYLAIFDDDDYSVPHRISTQLKRITSYVASQGEVPVLCFSARKQLFSDGSDRYEKTLGTEEGLAPNGPKMVRRILIGDYGSEKNNLIGSCANCACMGATEIFRNLNGFDPNMRRSEDTDFVLRFALNGGHFVGISETLVHQKMTLTSDKTLKKEKAAFVYFLKKHENLLRKMGWFAFSVFWIKTKFIYLEGKRLKFSMYMIFLFFLYPVKTTQKLIWAAPANETRKSFRNWHKIKKENK